MTNFFERVRIWVDRKFWRAMLVGLIVWSPIFGLVYYAMTLEDARVSTRNVELLKQNPDCNEVIFYLPSERVWIMKCNGQIVGRKSDVKG